MFRLHRLPLALAALSLAVLAAGLPVPAGAAEETFAAAPVERPAPPPLSKPALSKPAIAKPAIATPQAPSAPQAPVVSRPAAPAPLSPTASQPTPAAQDLATQGSAPGARATDGPSGTASRPEPTSDPTTLQRFFRSLQPDS